MPESTEQSLLEEHPPARKAAAKKPALRKTAVSKTKAHAKAAPASAESAAAPADVETVPPVKKPRKKAAAEGGGEVTTKTVKRPRASKPKPSTNAASTAVVEEVAGPAAAGAEPVSADRTRSSVTPPPVVAATPAPPAERVVSHPVPPAPASAGTDEWRPSSRREPSRETPPESAAQPARQQSSANDVASAPAAAVDPSVPVVRPRPVYIPRHVAKQLEEQARLSGDPNPVVPVAMPADLAPRFDPLPRHDSPRHDNPRHEHPRHERQRHDRSQHDHPRHDPQRRERQDFSDSEMPRHEPPAPTDEAGEAEGMVEVSGKGFGFIRDPKRGFSPHPQDTFITPEICRNHALRDGQWIKGETRRSHRGSQLVKLTELNGEDPEKTSSLPVFEELTVISPLERIVLETVPERYTTRVIDLMTPIGKGQRGLIVAPPRTGKTTLLQHIADAVVKKHPEIKLIILLVDERPEEVTEIKRTVPTAEVMASSNDSDVKSHTRIAQLAIERAKRLVEAGQDVFILLDSITRVGRAFNNSTGGGGRTMSGGIDSRALEIPRKIFAAARNTEEAGSLTIVATALIDTGSKMDELIFQEFKGTGNMELMLDRKISDQRIYPAVDIFLSGTRREELLIPADDLHKISVIRRGLAGHKPLEAMERLLFFLRKFPTNAQMLAGIPG